MRQGIPKISALQAFEATARLGSFSRAAEELSLTHSAVFRQVESLENSLGVLLFKRVRRRISLTTAGQEYAARIRLHLEQIQKDTLAVMSRSEIGNSLHLAALPTLTTEWLIPKLAEFKRLHPDIHISISARTQPFQFKDYPFDAAIYHASQPWENTESHVLFPEKAMVPICSSQLLARYKTKQKFDFANLPHLHLSTRKNIWLDWYEINGLAFDYSCLSGPRYQQFNHLMAAADAVLGVGLVPSFLAQRPLASGRLVQASEFILPVEDKYYFGFPKEQANNPILILFKDWLLASIKK